MAGEAPRTLSHFRLLERIGAGGMGEVWLAEDLELPRRVAIKLLPPMAAADPERVERLLREARAAARIDHPNVVTVHEAGIHDGHPYLVMARLEGETLEQRLARGPLPVAEAVAMTRAIADALAEVHALGIVHRDLNPANVILTARGPRVLDFGIAAIHDGVTLTRSGDTLGTPHSMSPEQLEGRPVDARSDLWALGVILHQSLTGVPPFPGASFAEVAHRVLNQEPPAASARNPQVVPELDRVIGALLRKDPAQRTARAEDLIAALDALSGAGDRGAGATATPRLAVLEFEVLGADPDDQLLAAGLAEDLMVDLARLPGLRVAGRGEVIPYRGRALPARTIARELGVDFVVHGSVRRAGARARISAQLQRAADGHAVWADRFDRTLEDLFEVQAEVSTRIARALEITLRPAEQAMLDRAPTRNREAYAFYLRGRAFGDEMRRESSQRAETCFREALALDPEFALAHAALAECLAQRATAWWAGEEVLSEATAAARHALALDPALPEAHMALGMVLRVQGDDAGVLEQVRAAQRLDSTDPEIMRWVGLSYMRLGRPTDAIAILEHAVASRPRDYRLLSAYIDCCDMLGRADAVSGQLPRMREVLTEALERAPDDAYARSMLSIVLAQAGEPQAGIAQAERAIASPVEDARVLYNAACAFTYAGEHARAIALLGKITRSHPVRRDWMRRDPDLAPLRELPGFIELFGPPQTS